MISNYETLGYQIYLDLTVIISGNPIEIDIICFATIWTITMTDMQTKNMVSDSQEFIFGS